MSQVALRYNKFTRVTIVCVCVSVRPYTCFCVDVLAWVCSFNLEKKMVIVLGTYRSWEKHGLREGMFPFMTFLAWKGSSINSKVKYWLMICLTSIVFCRPFNGWTEIWCKCTRIGEVAWNFLQACIYDDKSNEICALIVNT